MHSHSHRSHKQIMQYNNNCVFFINLRTCSISKLFWGFKSVQYNDGPFSGTWSLAQRLINNPIDMKMTPQFILNKVITFYSFYRNAIGIHYLDFAVSYIHCEHSFTSRELTKFNFDGDSTYKQGADGEWKYVWLKAAQPNNWKSQFDFFHSKRYTLLVVVARRRKAYQCMRLSVCLFMNVIVSVIYYVDWSHTV